MINSYISSKIKDKFLFTPNAQQEILIDKLSEFIIDDIQNNTFVLKGYAGTGKTTSIAAFVNSLEELKLKSVLLAPTGRAAKVLSTYSKKPAFTIHKKIYRQKSLQNEGLGIFSLDKNLHVDTIFIVDEASMISDYSFEQSTFGSGRLLEDLIRYVFEGVRCKLVLVGDSAQLPPVGLDISPALVIKTLESLNCNVKSYTLTDIVRQKHESGILENATFVRKCITTRDIKIPKLILNSFSDVKSISGSELIESISDNYDKIGLNETIIVCRSNKRANNFNQGIRKDILWLEDELAVGDLLMIVKNNYFWLENDPKINFIANGDIVEITRIQNYEELYGHRFANVTIKFPDYNDIEIDTKILLETLTSEKASMSSDENREFFFKVLEDYNDITPKKKRYDKVKNNEYFNALQVKFAYAVTCHKAQGGQWESVYIDIGYINKEKLNIEFLRWLYTAYTRAKTNLYFVNFDKDFFQQEKIIDYEY